jgi:hypothetical protein
MSSQVGNPGEISNATLWKQSMPNVVDPHRFDADPFPDPTFYFDADPDPDPYPDPTQSFSHMFTAASLHCFDFLVSVIGVIVFNILDRILNSEGDGWLS